jgi:twinkle protein
VSEFNESESGEFLYHTGCDKCGSSDAKAHYSTGTSYCWSCGTYFPSDGEAVEQPKRRFMPDLLTGEFFPLEKRRLTSDTCKKFGYSCSTYKGKHVQIAPYYKDEQLVAQHIRTQDKDFLWLGDSKGVELFGQRLWRTSGGKRLVITEGELDCMSVAQAFGLSWPVVSIPSGAQSAAKAIKNNIEFIESYTEVVIFFDNDAPGKEAAAFCAALISPGKVKVASVPEGMGKDANDLLQAGKIKELTNLIYEAKEWRPDGIVNGSELRGAIDKPIEWGLSYPWPELNAVTYGVRPNELVALGAGTGIGKTDLLKEIATHFVKVHKEKVGLIFLEEANKDTAIGLMSKSASIPFHIPDTPFSQEDKDRAFEDTLGTGLVYLYDHFGGTDYEVIKSKIKYLAVSCGVKYIFLDHVTALVSGDKDIDDRKMLDFIMTDLASLVRRLNINIHFISHLATPEGKPHEEGGRVMIRHFRGSRAIGQWSSFMLALERNQQSDCADERSRSILRVLKDRYTGRATGFTMPLRYDPSTARLLSDGDCSKEFVGAIETGIASDF